MEDVQVKDEEVNQVELLCHSLIAQVQELQQAQKCILVELRNCNERMRQLELYIKETNNG